VSPADRPGRVTPEVVEERLLGGPRRYRRDDVAAAAGVPVEDARRLWRAVGFADVGDEAVAFTDRDLDALRRVRGLVSDGVLDDELAVSVTRALGHNSARLVEWLYDALVEHLVEEGAEVEDAAGQAVRVVTDHLDDFDQLVMFVWRRQLAAVSGRALAIAARETVTGWLSVERELASLVDRFGRRSADVIAGAGGRLVKTVGDEVLFVADSAADAALIGLELAETMAEDPGLPDVRVGIATGTVLTRMGDVFGRTVNLASRLTALAAPGTVMVDAETARALEGSEDFSLDIERTRAVRGVGLVRPGVVRRTR
jgi:adenylate cyclase